MAITDPASTTAGVGGGAVGGSLGWQADDRNAVAKASIPARLRRWAGSGTTPSTDAPASDPPQNGHAGSLERTCR